MRASAKMHGTICKNARNDFKRFGYLPTNDAIAKVSPNDLDLFFQSKKFEIFTSWKQRELAQDVK